MTTNVCARCDAAPDEKRHGSTLTTIKRPRASELYYVLMFRRNPAAFPIPPRVTSVQSRCHPQRPEERAVPRKVSAYKQLPVGISTVACQRVEGHMSTCWMGPRVLRGHVYLC
jgi:hypothetical protein